eukprot:scaffold6990_cov22-Tisochrysis_lutea.AAC.3
MAIPPWVAHAEALPALPMAAALVHAHLGKQRYCAHVWENLEEYGRAGVVLRWEEEYGRTGIVLSEIEQACVRTCV